MGKTRSLIIRSSSAAMYCAAALLLLPSVARAQSSGAPGELRLPPGTYLPARDRAQLFECYERALTINLTLDSLQLLGLRAAIADFHTSTRPSPSVLRRRTAIRDSTVLALLRTAPDSAQYRRNSSGERAWWAAGNCNGRP